MVRSCRVANSILELTGATPCVRLARIPERGSAAVFVKLEHFNPTGSHKDRIAAKILEPAEADGLLAAGGTLVEASCGSLAVSLALVCAVKGYRLIAVVPDCVTREHLDVLGAYGASVELTPAAKGMAGAVARAKEIAAASGFFSPSQYDNAENFEAHAAGDGAELVAQARRNGGVDALTMTLGTGGTLGGVSKAVKSEFRGALIIGIAIVGERGGAPALPLGRPVLPGARPANVLEISEDAAWHMKQRLAREEGLLVGITSGANIAGALQIARDLGPGKSVYTLCCDTGERYLSLEGRFG
jgi:cysteine synthase A